MHIYHAEEPALTTAEVAALCEAFGIGKLLRFQGLDRARLLVETTEGLFGISSEDPAQFGTRHAVPKPPVRMLGRTYTCLEL